MPCLFAFQLLKIDNLCDQIITLVFIFRAFYLIIKNELHYYTENPLTSNLIPVFSAYANFLLITAKMVERLDSKYSQEFRMGKKKI